MNKEQAIEKLNDIRCHVKETSAEEQALVMAIDALKQPVATDTNVGDTISRQAALDALDKRFDNIPMEQTAEILMLRKDLRELPTIQPQSTTGQLNDGVRSTDLIDRGQAIEKFAMTAPQMSVIRIYEAVEILESMPTVQPEPHEGHWINGKCDLCGEHAPFWCLATTYHESNYCPHCGARMKGEQDGH